MDSLQYSLLIVFIQFLGISHKAWAISCFTCSSRNGSDITCEDPFQPGPFSYTEKCKVPKRGHKDGLFPAHFCIKLIAVTATTREKLVVRRCVMQNMENQCGKFKLENETLHGCLLTCDMDGCNSAPPSSVTSNNILMVVLATVATVCTLILQNNRSNDHLLFSHHQLSPSSSLYTQQKGGGGGGGDTIGQERSDRIFSPNFLHTACHRQISQLNIIVSKFFNNNLSRMNLSKNNNNNNNKIRHSNDDVPNEPHCTNNCNTTPLLIV